MITRREFFKLGGLSICVVLTSQGYKVAKAGTLKRHSPRLWINLSKDNRLIILVNKSEMGQGVYTGIAQLVADELDFPWDRVSVRPAPAGDKYIDPYMGSQLTGGSTSIRHMMDIMRSAGASMREMILQAASRVWKTPKENLEASLGKVIDKNSGRTATYGEFADLASTLPVPLYPDLKDPSSWVYIGRSVRRIDLDDKVEGSAKFALDHTPKNVLYAVVERPPSFGSKVISFDGREAKKVRGVTHVFKVGKGVAVCGENSWAVLEGRKRVRVKWSKGKISSLDTEGLKTHFLKVLKKRGRTARRDGDPEKVFKGSEKKIDLTYTLPYLYHACMEPMSCTVELSGGSCTIHAPTQNQTWVLRHAKRILGLPESRIRVNTTYLGGGFGRKSNSEFVKEALEIAKRTGRSVKLFFTREDDIKSGWFRPMCVARVKGSVDESGMPNSLIFKIAVPSVFEWAGRKIRRIDPASVSGVANTFYEIPNVHVSAVKVDLPIPVWFWRSVGHSHNAYIMETFIDQLAHLGGKDPVDLRLDILGLHTRAQGVIEKVAEASGWHKGAQEGEALGIAYHYSFGTHVAQVAEVSLEKGKVKVHKVVCAVDLGSLVINPDLVVQQMESSIIMGMSAFLYEMLRFKNGGVENTNFDTYPLLRMDETPRIEVHIVRSEGEMGGVGEPGLPPVAPAIANALFKIKGSPLTELPFYS